MKTHHSSYKDHSILQEKNNFEFVFNEHEVLHELKHYLPAQAPLKDFIHHNTLHAFQNLKFDHAIRTASQIFGYKVSLSLNEYRTFHASGRIEKDILEKIIIQKKGKEHLNEWLKKVHFGHYVDSSVPRIGLVRSHWKREYHIDMDSMVHPTLFRILCSYLDQGISIWNFPSGHKGFLSALREMERNSYTSFFKTERAKNYLLQGHCELHHLLKIIVGDEALYQHYLFDQQFAHQGWSGMVSTIEDNSQSLLDPKKISLRDLIIFELLLEIDALDAHFGTEWQPLSSKIKQRPIQLFSEVAHDELHEIIMIWQEALEWTYYDEVLSGIRMPRHEKKDQRKKSFQAMFCLDDRETSLRTYIEKQDEDCETFGTPGFFSVEFYFQPEHGKFYTKVCPAPVNPKFLVKEIATKEKRKKDIYFTKHTHTLFRGWLITQTLGFWSAFKLFLNIFKPSLGPASAYSFNHMDRNSRLIIENKNPDDKENGLQIGFTTEEMAPRVESLLKSVGLVKDFAPIIYLIGHGSSSVNNPHYAAYDCGACSGRPGSVNARVMSYMANHPKVREILKSRGIEIPEQTQFLGGLHDTCRDEVGFFDEEALTPKNWESHKKNKITFEKALDLNAKERSRRFVSINTKLSPEKVHEQIKKRSVALFEPRPELNHATNSLCIIGKRILTKELFLDRRAFLNSYDYRIDPDGQQLFNIIKAAAPVCGGINLEYYFSRVDNQKLGAGTKLPHNVMGLFGVANGIDGDLRPGLPSQMIEIHDPIRLLMVVEHFPEVVMETIQRDAETYEWFINDWVYLVVVNPKTLELSLFKEGAFTSYQPLKQKVEMITDIMPLIETHQENLPVYLIP